MRIHSICSKEEKLKAHNAPHINPIYATSAFNFESLQEGINIFNGSEKGFVYGRFGNPNTELLQNKLAKLEGWGLPFETRAIVTNSGMSAISILLNTLLKPGDTLITQPALYGGTLSLIENYFRSNHINILYCDLNDLVEVENKLEQIKGNGVLFIETPANPTLDCYDLQLLSELASQHGFLSACDNTFASPILQQPMKQGIDYVVHSNTKYINGHGNSISGVIVGKKSDSNMDKVFDAMKLMGANCSPFEAWLCYQGMKTMALRVQKQTSNAGKIATFLNQSPSVSVVNYPGLKKHPTHEIAQKQMKGFGGMLSFDLGSIEFGKKFIQNVKFISLAPTLGDVDTIALHPASMSHLNMDPDKRKMLGITDGLIRMSVGIEDVEDIIEDLNRALERLS
ncbi:trans-sulfuration enzyme family protein [Membranihabitans maritimus]|uniref:trans-sulfuration enzyme family protein n=1 Tax=Membranihabitans maritimus TaxID=2904244 RepID=UPI001F28B036|nr:PLP-dependent aspartate aminotransferase family protein [Membranihabitans maritimus]